MHRMIFAGWFSLAREGSRPAMEEGFASCMESRLCIRLQA